MKTTLLLALIFLPLAAHATTAQSLSCQADFDESSYYLVEASFKGETVQGPVSLRYVTEDGLDLQQDLASKGFQYHPGEVLKLKAANDNMSLALDGVEVVPGMGVVARLTLSFSLEHAEPLELSANCSIK